jgi:hypothetical protein
VPVRAEIRYYDDATIRLNVSGDSLESNFIQGNRWYFNDVEIPGATGQRIRPDRTGIYSVVVDARGCTTSADYEFTIAGTEKKGTPVMQVFPNPIINGFTVSLPRAFAAVEGLRVINNLGVVVGMVTLKSRGEIRTGYFDMTPFPRGVYFLQPLGADGPDGVKLIKE